ncbi:aspartate aminotransferase family protein [Conexibacter sp. CPCC 206217]|uniref:aminotransferase family protein n=1 Tax=Conexibacter sp. CPCC 206217 TaxID=3064574 RepID=UPI00272825C3|nr:aminotransferase class III-fold pyridoxal phosphate-dependent enzyme [Conexibacter sp. CPCC 206217]MDO8211737.1 aminotransferase class III-fold pyridoxal phosphate-dependent enzyme [Conexibacter sp. CPCC 206217]
MTNDTRFWHPFSDMGAVGADGLFTLARAEGVWIWDTRGERYLDATASLWYANVGHGRAEIADAVHDQLLKLDAYSTFGDYANEPSERLAQRLAAHAPMDDARIYLTSGGGDSIDTAAKLARQYFSVLGQPERVVLLSRTNGYHGTHGYGTAIGGIEANRAGYGPLMEHTALVPWDSLPALEETIQRIGPHRIAAFFAEPVIGAGGVLPPPDGYLEGVAAICREHGILFVVDAVICGFGRLGEWFGIERWGVTPDMIVFAKGVTSGYQPLGGVVVGGEIAEPFFAAPGHFVRHGATYAGHPACCAAANANLDILEREGLIARGRELEEELAAVLAPLTDHPLVREVRAGTGLLAAFELEPAALAGGLTVPQVSLEMRARGVLTRPLGNAVAVSPPLTVQRAELELIGEVARISLDAILERMPPLAARA